MLELANSFINPLRSYLKTIEQIKPSTIKCSDQEASKLCLSKNPIAIMNIWETLIEAQKNKEFVKFMLTMNRKEEDFKGEITGWNIYKHSKPLIINKQKKLDGSIEILETIERLVYMPETKILDDFGRPIESLGPLNPYRSFKTSHSTISRTMRNIETLDLEFVYSIVFTLPKEVSNLYEQTTQLDKIDVRINKCIKDLAKYLSCLLGGKIGMAVNKHVWSSMKPLEAHAHAHALLLDRLITKEGDKQIIPSWFMAYDDRTRRYIEGPLTKILKRNWALIVNKEFNLNYQDLDINIEFVELKKLNGSENTTGCKKLIHKLKYNRRRPIADLALFYLFNNFNCNNINDEFAEHLLNYTNRTQVYGYWNRISKYARRPKEDLEPNNARCPICNQKLIYVSFQEGRELIKDVLKVFIDRKGMFWKILSTG